MEFNLLDGFPLLTTKKMPWKTILRELIWFIKGETDNKILNDQKVHIWDLNSTKEFLESRNLSYEIEGDLGPIYGFNGDILVQNILIVILIIKIKVLIN